MVSNETHCCSVCSAELFLRGLRSRTLTDSSGDKIKLIIRRLQCSGCSRIHHELPDCIVPYKRHCAETIESIINNSVTIPCENRTIRRISAWWRVVNPYFMNILKSITEKHKIKFQAAPSFREIVRAAAGSCNWIFQNSV